MQQTSSVMLLKYICAYTLTGYFRGLHHSLQHMRGEEQTDNFLADLIIFLTLLIQLDGGIHEPIEEEEAEGEDEGEDKEVCESACEFSPCVENKCAEAAEVVQSAELAEAAVNTLKEPEAKVEVVSETVTAVATETLPEVVASEQSKIVLKAVRVADKREECCVIS